jgi:hypothetical protein
LALRNAIPPRILLDGKDKIYWTEFGTTVENGESGNMQVANLVAITRAKKVEVQIDGHYFLMRPELQELIREFLNTIGVQ